MPQDSIPLFRIAVKLFGFVEDSGRDKSGTTACNKNASAPNRSENQPETTRSWLNAERAGFEPAVRFDPHTAFPVPHNRPLCHLSGFAFLPPTGPRSNTPRPVSAALGR